MNNNANIDSILNGLGEIKEKSVQVIPNTSGVDDYSIHSIDSLIDSHIFGILSCSKINSVQINLLSYLLNYKAHMEA